MGGDVLWMIGFWDGGAGAGSGGSVGVRVVFVVVRKRAGLVRSSAEVTFSTCSLRGQVDKSY